MADPKNPQSQDTDGDGLSDAFERDLGTNPRNRDSDGDRLDDGVEVATVSRPRVRGSSDWADYANDGIRSRGEKWAKDHRGGRLDADDDHDGVADWIEAEAGLDTIPHLTAGDVENLQPIDAFVDKARMQLDKPYKFGAEVHPDNPSGGPAWDSSELVEWAAKQAGVREMPDTALQQYRWLRNQHATVKVDDALHTKGALVFGFSSDPSQGRPARAYVAISVGDGKHVIDVSERGGKVAELPAGRHVFTHGAVIPQLHRPTGDFDNDGFSDALELKTGGDFSAGITPLTGRPTPTGAGTGSPSTTIPPDAGALLSPMENPAYLADPTDALGTDQYRPDARPALDEDDPLGVADPLGHEDLATGHRYDDPFGDDPAYAATSDGEGAGDVSTYGDVPPGSIPYDGSGDGGAGSASADGGPDIGGAYADSGVGQEPAQAVPGLETDDTYVSFDDDPGEAADESDAGFYDDDTSTA